MAEIFVKHVWAEKTLAGLVGVRIYVVLDGTDFTRADLRYVKFIGSSLNYFKFNDSCMAGVDFGEKPHQLTSEI